MQTCPSYLFSASQPQLAQMKLKTSLSGFLHPFSSSFLYLSFLSMLARDYFCHIFKKEEQKPQTSSAFKLVQNRTAMVQARNSRLLFQQRSLMNKTVKTRVSLYAEMESKRRYSIPVCHPTHSKNTV